MTFQEESDLFRMAIILRDDGVNNLTGGSNGCVAGVRPCAHKLLDWRLDFLSCAPPKDIHILECVYFDEYHTGHTDRIRKAFWGEVDRRGLLSEGWVIYGIVYGVAV